MLYPEFGPLDSLLKSLSENRKFLIYLSRKYETPDVSTRAILEVFSPELGPFLGLENLRKINDICQTFADCIKNIQNYKRTLMELKKVWETPAPNAPFIERSIAKLIQLRADSKLCLLHKTLLQEIKQQEDRWEELKKARSDIRARRESLMKIARKNKLICESTGTTDYIAPFRVEHQPNQSQIFFGRIRLEKLSYPTANEIFEVIQKSHQSLQSESRKDWDSFLQGMIQAQSRISSIGPVPWKALLDMVIPDAKIQRRMELVLCYRLALLIEGQDTNGWKAVVTPPTLTEQTNAWSIPRLHRAHEIVRVWRVRLVRTR